MKKYYVIRQGKKTGIFDSRDETKSLVEGYTGAKYKAFKTHEEAQQAYRQSPDLFYQSKEKHQRKTQDLPFEKNSIAVDAACSGNPGKMEYQGIDLVTEKKIFHETFPMGTNNIGEFLAIVHGLLYLQKHHSNQALYSDSKHAIKWVQQKKCKTALAKTPETKKLFEIIKRAEDWLQNTTYTNQILKRHTDERGEIPADFDRK